MSCKHAIVDVQSTTVATKLNVFLPWDPHIVVGGLEALSSLFLVSMLRSAARQRGGCSSLVPS